MSAHQRILAGSFGFSQPQLLNVSFRSTERQTPNTGRASIAAMNYIANSGIPLRTDSDFPIQHDKVIIVDNVTVETGSFNFTKAAETKNSENAVVIWNMPKLAESFLEHWQDRWNRGRDYRSSY